MVAAVGYLAIGELTPLKNFVEDLTSRASLQDNAPLLSRYIRLGVQNPERILTSYTLIQHQRQLEKGQISLFMTSRA